MKEVYDETVGEDQIIRRAKFLAAVLDRKKLYVDGIQGVIRPDAGARLQPDFEYDHQEDFPAPPAPSGDYLLYADVWERTVTHLLDKRLRDEGLHGADTCSRKQTMAQVKWCQQSVDPEQAAQNPPRGNAELTVTLLRKTTEPDPCDPCADQLPVASKVGNYLFRVEVHDFGPNDDGDPILTLKWSGENGAEQFEALPTVEEMPAGFISDKWVYEFFDRTSEKYLGVHFAPPPWKPSRGVITEIKAPDNPYTVPPIPGSSESKTFVRRWDGYCTLNLNTNTLLAGKDKEAELSRTAAPDALVPYS